jgi:hypothetical protein
MTARCEPPPGVADWSYHWLRDPDGDEVPLQWSIRDDCGPNGGEWWLPDGDCMWPEHAHEKGWRYLSPVPSPAELAALVEAARDVLRHAGIADQNPEDVDGEDHARESRLRAALIPFATATGDAT